MKFEQTINSSIGKIQVYSQEGLLGKTVYLAYRDNGFQLFGLQVFDSIEQIKKALKPSRRK